MKLKRIIPGIVNRSIGCVARTPAGLYLSFAAVLVLLLLPLETIGRVGGGHSYGGGSRGGGGSSGGDGDGGAIIAVVRILIWLTIEYPAV